MSLSTVEAAGVEEGEKGRAAKADIISSLPQDVTCKILECLCMKEVVRTCSLSTDWRYNWSLVPDVTFDQKFRNDLDKGRERCPDFRQVYSDTISSILFGHKGGIRKFALYLPYWFSNDEEFIKWMKFICQNRLKEFTLEDERYPNKDLPDCLFSCVNLTRFELINCSISSLPPTFKGFPCLTRLELTEKGTSTSACIKSEVLEQLISGCPMLENLQLRLFRMTECNWVLCAPRLKKLNYSARLLQNVTLKDTTNIQKLSLTCYWIKSMRDRLSCFLNVEELFLQDLSWLLGKHSLDSRPARLDCEFRYLRILHLRDLPVNCSFGVLAVMYLFQSSPNLEDVCINASRCRMCHDKLIGMDRECRLPRLRSARFVLESSGSRDELRFIKAVLAISPMLEYLIIELGDDAGAKTFAKKLKQFSPQVATKSLKFASCGPLEFHF